MPESLAAYVANAVIVRHYLHDFQRCTIDDDAFKHAINLLLLCAWICQIYQWF